MNRQALVIVAVLIAAGNAHAAGLYKCVDPVTGKTTFSQFQCAPDAAPVDVRIHAPTAEQVQAHAARVESDIQFLDEESARRRAMEAAAARQQAVENARTRHAAEISAIAARRARAANNLAGATWENALSQDAAAADARYQAEMDRLRGER
ncbi:DUF4124 domain-containing protein [Thiocystis violacea]|uniref:DUF4124 domain-containing protein n=1 Tax=Thiocystis violacea TaxID=13725 RepID=UPI001908AA95|nr:DUF4124 domain-containing protein [Thiocystis violacea]